MKEAIYCPNSITVNLRPDLDKFIRELSKDLQVSMNKIINDAIDDYMKAMKGEYEHYVSTHPKEQNPSS